MRVSINFCANKDDIDSELYTESPARVVAGVSVVPCPLFAGQVVSAGQAV